MAVPQIDLVSQHEDLLPQLREAFDDILATGGFLLGPYVEAFERKLAAVCATPHAIALSSGTDALLVSLMACGFERGDEVIVPSFTFFATAGSVVRAGLTPVFVDIEPRSFNIDPEAVAAAVTDRTRAIIPVHLFGQAADMARINEIAAAHGLVVIEDAAQAIGAGYEGQPVGGLGRLGCLSFYPTKNLAGLGDGGAVVTCDDELAARVRCLRNHGQTGAYEHQYVGGNFRLDAIQGAALGLKIDRLASYNERRGQLACYYFEKLAGLPLALPEAEAGRLHVYNQFTVRVGEDARPAGAARERDALLNHLNEHGVAARVYYPRGLHEQPCFAGLGRRVGDLDRTERACGQVLSLPIFPEMTGPQQDEVVAQVRSYFS